MTYGKTSEVWNHFTQLSNGREAKCTKCNSILGCKGSSTSALINHLKKHGIFVTSSVEKKKLIDSERLSKQSSLLSFIDRDLTLGGILARCAAKDNMSVHSILDSFAVQEYVAKKNFKMPSCDSTIWSLIYEFYKEK